MNPDPKELDQCSSSDNKIKFLKMNNRTDLIKIKLKRNGKLIVAKDEDIIMIQASGSYSFLYLKNGENICTSKHLKFWENTFNSVNLMRIHSGYLINCNAIISINHNAKVVHLEGNCIAKYSRRMSRKLLNVNSYAILSN